MLLRADQAGKLKSRSRNDKNKAWGQKEATRSVTMDIVSDRSFEPTSCSQHPTETRGLIVSHSHALVSVTTVWGKLTEMPLVQGGNLKNPQRLKLGGKDHYWLDHKTADLEKPKKPSYTETENVFLTRSCFDFSVFYYFNLSFGRFF